MKKQIIVLALMMAAMLVPAKAQFMQMGVKLQYSTSTIDDMVSNVTETYQNFSTDFLKSCDAGVFLRFNVGRWVTIQPEANFSISAVWDSVDAQNDFIGAAAAAFSNVQTVNLSVPILAAAHLVDIENTLDLRAFVGPEFYTTVKGASETGMDLATFSIVLGVSLDLLDVIYVDGRVVKYKDGGMFYRLGVGLLF